MKHERAIRILQRERKHVNQAMGQHHQSATSAAYSDHADQYRQMAQECKEIIRELDDAVLLLKSDATGGTALTTGNSPERRREKWKAKS